MAKRWLSTPPKKCDICEIAIDDVFIDGATSSGPWAFMCEDCHHFHGMGLGLGRGQRFVRKSGGKNFYLKQGDAGPGR